MSRPKSTDTEPTVRVPVRLTQADYARLKRYARSRRTPMAAIIYNAVIHHLDDNENALERSARMVLQNSVQGAN